MRLPRHVLRSVGLLLGLAVFAGLLVAGVAFPAAVGLGMVANDASDSVGSSSTDLVDRPLPQSTVLTDNAGTPIAKIFEANQNRRSVTIDEISPAMQAAIVAVEDRRFYQHQGVDWQGTARALVTNSVAGSIEQGASTLTQQYVKNYLLYVEADTETERLQATEQTPARKLREAQIALQLEQTLSKDEILTRYLNIVPFGNGAAGIDTAARTYFGTTPDQLTIPQAAMLAGMVRSAQATDPVTNPERALDRRNLVIQQMLDQGMIDEDQAAEATASPLGVASPLNVEPNGCIGAGSSGFFCQYVQQYMNQAGFSREQLASGGYTIRTTLDPDVQATMQAALTARVAPDQPDVANVMAMVEPGTEQHRVLAMGSNRVFGLNEERLETQYGLPYQPVPPGAGSIYKLFTAATALEKGLGINYQLDVPPSGYASPIYIDGAGNPLPVRNSSEYRPTLSITDALAQSPNTAFIRLMEFTGVPDVVDMAVRLGMRSLAEQRYQNTDRSIAEVTKEQQRASFTLGVTPTSVLELGNVGATLASGGVWCPPSPIESITDPDGNDVPIIEASCDQVVEPGLANAMMSAMGRDELPGGTAFRAASEVDWERPMAGKTGTTQDNRSAAFIGILPQLSGAVITFDDDSTPDRLCDGPDGPFACANGNIFGGRTPAQTWFGTMTPLMADQPVIPLPPVEERYLSGGGETTVPDLVGRPENDARRVLEDAGFAVTTRSVDNAAPRGTVIGQTPRGPGLPGQPVELTLSSGRVPPPPAAPTGGG